MRVAGVVAFGWLALAACGNSGQSPLIDGGGASSSGSGTTTSSSSGTGTTSGGSSGTTTSGTVAGTTTSGSTTGASTTAGTTTGTGGTTGGLSPPPCAWVNDTCGVLDCTNQSRGTVCTIDGGIGHCYGGMCQTFDLQSDPNNCGDYGLVCPPSVPCVQGMCNPLGKYTCGGTCPPGTACLFPRGGISLACELTSCANGLDDQACMFGGFCCGGQCIGPGADPGIGPDNCGGCGVHCSDGTVCVYGQCVLANACTANDDGAVCQLSSGGAGGCCAEGCVDLSSDSTNCGECGATCAAGTPCVDGTCSTTQPTTCGADGAVCPVSTESWTCCGEACVDVSSDPANCGACGQACAAGQACFGYGYGCAFGSPTCDTNGDFCVIDGGSAGTCCAGRCIAPDDLDNCAACGAGCAVGTYCQPHVYYRGEQLWFAPCVPGDGGSLACGQDGDCDGGRVCTSGGFCATPSCDAGTSSCALAEDGGLVLGICCGDTCVDPNSDPANCAGCGQTCAPGTVCADRVKGCMDPSSGFYDCSACPAGTFCEAAVVDAAAVCLPTTCGPGSEGNYCLFGPLSYFVGICCSGACVDVGSDPFNCYGCGISCPSGRCDYGCQPVPQSCLQTCGPGTICADAICVDSSCQAGQVHCLASDGTVGDCCASGDCATLSDDPLNCGACGIVCPTGTTCQNGYCNGVVACGPGHANSYCNPDAGLFYLCCPGVGCTDTAFDSANCGACNAACAAGQTCDAGVCG